MLGVVHGFRPSHPLDREPVDRPDSHGRQTPPAKSSAQAAVRLAGAGTPTPKTSLYECLTGGVRVYSQQRCGANAKLREIDSTRMNTFQSKVYSVPGITESVAVNGPGDMPYASRDAIARGLESGQGGLCADIELAIHRVETRLRQGYSVPEGDDLRAKLHQLIDASHEQKCG